MPRREDHEVYKDMWGHWGGDIKESAEETIDYRTSIGSSESAAFWLSRNVIT